MMFSKVEIGNVLIKHHSTSSTIEIVITTVDEETQGVSVKTKQSTFIDYNTFENIRMALSDIDKNENKDTL